ncbi:MAG: TonB-dependent receptor [Robiginitomaculum sp.]|nr:TonB-dependent receptor [Robiginitomaculum sp.]
MSTFKQTLRQTSMWVAASAVAMAFATPTFAQSGDEEVVDEIVTIGSRSSKPRSIQNSTVPIDVISGEEFSNMGNVADITDSLKTLIPSYTATPATGDGSSFVRPTSLRGTASDQTLVMVNGKRRHRSALVQFFAPAAGNGAQSPDVAMIPSIALKRVEVLRDGAAAQYGSDAIAGVINFVLKDSAEGGEVVAQYGQFYEGEVSYKIAGNVGLPIGDKGFVNISGEYVDNEALSRGLIRPDAQALIDAGVAGVGGDSPFGDAPFTQTWGRPETSGLRLFVNSAVEINSNVDAYLFGNFADTDGRYRFFYRNPGHSTLATLNGLGFTGLPAGYTPYLDGKQQDFSAVGGFKGTMDSGWFYDLSLGYGKNTLDYTLFNTINPSLGLDASLQIPQRDFQVGGYEQREINLNVDMSKQVSDTVNFAFGGEWRRETYVINPGEPNSYLGSGSNGLGGFSPADSGSFSRSNYAAYADVEHELTDRLLMQYAVRFEDFSDFGSTINWKVAGSYAVTDDLNFRGAVSTGFHAPTPGQANVRTTITTFDGVTGLQVEEGLVPPGSAAALAAGGAPLREETSTNYSFGFASSLSDRTSLTVDAYRIDVRDRIYRTGDIAVPGSTTGATISFYTNALDVRHSGLDVVLASGFDWNDNVSTDISLAASYNQINVLGQQQVITPTGPVTPVSDANVEDIENNYPSMRFVLGTNTYFADDWNLMVRANYYGTHYDERGRIGAAVNPSAEIAATIYFDAELGYDVNDMVRVAFGGSNIFNSYVGTIGAPNANRLSVGLQYPRRSAANYEGGSWYANVKLKF